VSQSTATTIPDHPTVEIKEHFVQLADAIHEVFWISQVDFFRFLYVSPAYERIWGASRESLYENPAAIIESVLPEDRMRWVVGVADQAHPQTEIEYRIRRPDGQVRWIRTRLFPIPDKSGEVLRVAGVSEDITDRKVAEKEILEVSGRERRRMGEEIHDGICQQLTGIVYMLKTLEKKLSDHGLTEAHDAAHMGRLMRQTIDQARRLARGLYPVQLEANALMSALGELALSMRQLYNVRCTFESSSPILIEDPDVATHLYRIAQEATTNAVTHGRASRIIISLTEEAGVIYLRIRDNGHGPPHGHKYGRGMGLRIMDYRARMIGGKLTVQKESAGGMLVTCGFPVPSRHDH